MKKFIYVVGEYARDKLLDMGYELRNQIDAQDSSSETRDNIYVFANKEHEVLNSNDFAFVLSNTLTF